MATNPLELVENLNRRLQDLVLEQTPLRQELGFRAAFETLVGESRFLAKVLFEARPPFVRLDRAEFEADPRPHPEILQAMATARPGDAWHVFHRPYWHQVAAFRASVEHGQSVVLATGTASGKTESMALPILDGILRDRDRGGSGARALFVFPLNALATDQAERLDRLAQPLRLTVGTMNGLTPSNEKKRLRAQPPDILITNFTMLEYMLLRPADHGMLGPALRYLALDEAHVYRGALGRDMSLLLHRVRLHLAQNGADPEQLSAFLASATLGGGEEDTLRFAAELTGIEAARFDLVRPSFDLSRLDELPGEVRAVLAPLVASLPPDPRHPGRTQVAPPVREVAVGGAGQTLERDAVLAAIDRWLAASPGESALRDWQLKVHALAHGLGGLLVDLPGGRQPFGRLHQEEHLEEPAGAPDPVLEPVDAVSGRPLFRLLACDRCGMPYLFGYVHQADDGVERLCADPPPVAEDGVVMSLFLGWPELLGEQEEHVLLDGGDRRLRPTSLPAAGQRRFVKVDEVRGSHWEVVQLKKCAACDARNPRSSVTTDFVTDTEDATSLLAKELLDAQVQTDRSAAESHERVLELLFRQHHEGGDTVVPKLLSFSDTRRDAARFAPIMTSFQFERWVLARADAVLRKRKDRAAREQLDSGLILEALVEAICEQVQRTLGAFLDAVGLDEEPPDPKEEVERTLLRLFGKRVRRSERGEHRRLATVEPPPHALSRWLRESGLPPEIAQPLFLRLLDEARYDMFWHKGWRVEGDDEFPLGQNQKRCFGGLDGGGKDEAVVGWHQWVFGAERQEQETNLARMVRQVMGSPSTKSDRERVLQDLWDCWHKGGVLMRQDLSGGRSGYTIDWRNLRFDVPDSFLRCPACGHITARDRWSAGVCLTCEARRDGEQCEPYRACTTDLNLFSALEHTAQWAHGASLRVMQAFKRWEKSEEDKKFAAIRGPVHLLSSSTTYEVGVDLGDLANVLLRNLPASTASFVQRVGRAGRREGQAALSVTYLRPFATDRIALREPARWFRVRPPTIKRDVPVMVQRHVRAALLSWSIRECALHGFGEDEDADVGSEGTGPVNLTLAHFYVDADHVERCAPVGCRDRIREWLGQYRQQLPRDGCTAVYERLAQIPASVHRAILEHVAGDLPAAHQPLEAMIADLRRRLTEHREQFEEECRFLYGLVAQVQESLAANARKDALDILERLVAAPYRPPRAAGLWQRMVIPEWAKAGLTPGYAFPIHPVRLDVRSGRGRLLELERDATLGLAEYVPGAQVTAGSRVYESKGVQLARPPKADPTDLREQWQIALDVQWCVYCARCGHLKIHGSRDDLASDPDYETGCCPGCGGGLVLPSQYTPPQDGKKKRRGGADPRRLGVDLHLFPVVRPRGFMTLDQGARVYARQGSIPAQPPRWLPHTTEPQQLHELAGWRLRWRQFERERIAVVNLGRYRQRGFRLCPNTGLDLDLQLGKDVIKDAQVPWFGGQSGRFKMPVVAIPDRVGLFTQFETDVLVLEPARAAAAPGWDEIVARSFMTALLVVAPDLLQAERREVGGLLHPRRLLGEPQRLQLVLYDNVHGGAGLMRELVPALDGEDGLFARALGLLESCHCRRSCPNCLKLPWNQRDHGSLDRLRSRDWLRAARAGA